jgi:hypothetical protein
MVTTQACYSRVDAIIGSQTVREYSAGTVVSVVAITDTGYYKLADGTFIHTDYLVDTDAAPTATQATTTAPVTAGPVPNEPADNTNVVANGSYTSRYFWSQLTADEQTFYAALVNAARNFDTRMISAPQSLDYAGMMKIYFLIFNMEPQLFWLDTSASSGPGYIRLNYTTDKEGAAVIQNEIDATTRTIMNSANQKSSVASKLLVFYNYIILNNDFYLTGTAATCGIENGLRPSAPGIQCNGYAKTMQYLCDKAGIECLTVPGMNAHGSTHAWNKVKVGGKWYNIDSGWGDPDNRGGKFISHPFFLVPDAWTTESHLQSNTKTLSSGTVIKFFITPVCNSTDLNYFKLMNREYTGFDAAYAGMAAEIKRAIAAGEKTAEIRVTDKETFDLLLSKDVVTKLQKYARQFDPTIGLMRQQNEREQSLVVQYDFRFD